MSASLERLGPFLDRIARTYGQTTNVEHFRRARDIEMKLARLCATHAARRLHVTNARIENRYLLVALSNKRDLIPAGAERAHR